MPTESENRIREIRSREEIADKDRAQKERSDKRSAKASFYGNAVKAIGSVLGKINDSSWYKRIPGSSEVNASIPDFQIMGIPDATILQGSGTNVPAVVAINFGPTIGNTRSTILGDKVINVSGGLDSTNRALNRVCTQLEQRNSRVSTYPRDVVGRYLFIVTDIASDILKIKSAIDCYDMVSGTKPLLARRLIRAYGFNYPDFKANISAYRSMYVSLAHDFNEGLPIPADLSFLRRQLWLAHTIVKDSKTEYATLLVFNKAIDFHFPEVGSALTNIPDNYISYQIPAGGYTFSIFTRKIRVNISHLVNGVTWKSLIRDLRGGTRSNSWLKLPVDATKKTITITDADEVRNQIQNLISAPVPRISYATISGTTCEALVIGSFSIGGTPEESVEQSAYCGSGHSRVGEPSATGTLHSFLPGTLLWASANLTESGVVSARLKSFPQFLGQQPFNKSYLINNMKEGLSSDDYLVGSRFMCGYARGVTVMTYSSGDELPQLATEMSSAYSFSVGANYFNYLYPAQYGTEIVLSITMEAQNADDNYVATSNYITTLAVLTDSDSFVMDDLYFFSTDYVLDVNEMSSMWMDASGYQSTFYGLLGMYSTLDWHPFYDVTIIDSLGDVTAHRKYGELDHYTTFGAAVMGKLHAQCVESEFTLPEDIYLPPLK